jgi:hypothetical protein
MKLYTSLTDGIIGKSVASIHLILIFELSVFIDTEESF